MRSTRTFAVMWFLAAAVAHFAMAGEVPQAVLRSAAGVRPTPQQLAWQQMEFICFAHFGINTFTNREWGDGKEDPRRFNPTALDADQWVRACKSAGMTMIILTAKHHDGFCLFPSKYTEHTVKNSPWRAGRGDVVREVAEARRTGGLKFGVYLSPWDRHEPTYGSDAYNEHFKNQLRELLTGYGEVTEVWFDGACGEGPNGRRQVYDWDGYFRLIRQLMPNAVIAIMGPDVRWVGNESGLARESEWSVVPEGRDFQKKDLGARKYLASGERLVWYPAECDVSIRPGWFYHSDQDGKVKSLSQLLDIYYRSVGRNSVLLLNVPPDRRGMFHENDVARLQEFREVREATFKTNLTLGCPVRVDGPSARGHDAAYLTDGKCETYWTTAGGVTTAALEVDLGRPVRFDRAMLQEAIREGQRVERFAIDVWQEGLWRTVAEATTIGYKRLLRFPEACASRVRLRILESRDSPALCEFGLFKASDKEQTP